MTLAGCGSTVVNPVTGRAERTVMDEATEVVQGRKAHEAVIAEMGVQDNPGPRAYAAPPGQKLARQSVALPAVGLSDLARRTPLPDTEAWLQLINGVCGSNGGSSGALRPGQPVTTAE